jgi:glycosyltransferase involved in cell wall biosynthesis
MKGTKDTTYRAKESSESAHSSADKGRSTLRVIVFTWEFPPRIVGQLAQYVNMLAVELVKKNIDIHVVTYNNSWTGYHEGADGVKAYRISDPFRPHNNVLTWILSLNQEVERIAADIYYSVKREVDLIDVHDWHFVPAAVSLKRGLEIPFVFSVDSIEDHRSHGSTAPLSLSIKSMESLGVKEANRVIVKSDWMKREMNRAYKAPPEKTDVVLTSSSNWADEMVVVFKKMAKVNAR